MDPGPLLDRVFDDESLTADLDGPEAELLLRAVAERVRTIAKSSKAPDHAATQVEALCRSAREIARQASSAKYPHRRLAELLPGLD